MFTDKNKRKIKLQRNNKRRLIAFYSAILGIILLGVAGMSLVIVIRNNRPLFVSPLAALQALASASNDDEQVTFIKKTLKDKSIPYTGVETKDSSYMVTLENNAQVTISAKKDIIGQISSLQFIITRLTMEGRQFRTLDLSYDKPIIVFKE